MKKQLLYSAVVALMLGTSTTVWAEPGEADTPPTQPIEFENKAQSSTNSNGLDQLQPNMPNGTATQPESGAGPQGQPATSPNTNAEHRQDHLLPTILGGTGIFLALLSLIYSWRKAGSMILTKKQLEDEIKKLRNSEHRLKEQIAEVFKSFQQHQELNNNIIKNLQDEISHLKHTLSLGNEDTTFGELDRKFLVNDDLVINPVAEVAPVVVQLTDTEIIDKISLAINGFLQTSTDKFKTSDFKTILDGLNKNELNIHSYRLLQNDLESEGGRGFDAIVIFLNKALSSGVNTLIYLQKNVAQHSAISWVFDNARDGMVISEMLEPAQIRLANFAQLDLREENIVQKGKVAEG